jgi:recombination protein RecA
VDRSISPDREARLQAVLRELERRFGPWIVYRLRDARPSPRPNGTAIPSGSLGLDHAIGVGGFPRGRIVELIGPPTSGKSLLSYHLLANAQRRGGFVTFVDSAHRADFEQMARCGVDLADLFLVVPESIVEAIEVAALLVESGGLDALAIGPLADLIGSSLPKARLAANRLARLNAVMASSPTVVAFLTDRMADHSTDCLPDHGPRSASRAPLPPWGRALRHFASLRIQLTPLKPLAHPSGDVVGLRVRAEAIKNRLAAAERRVELDLRRDRGIHREAELIDLGLATAVLVDRPLGLCFDAHLLGRGRARAIATLENDPALAHDIERRIAASLASRETSGRDTPHLPDHDKSPAEENG